MTTTSKQFRSYAHECLFWAEQATTTTQRDSFLKIAQALNQAATQADGIGIARNSSALMSSPKVGRADESAV